MLQIFQPIFYNVHRAGRRVPAGRAAGLRGGHREHDPVPHQQAGRRQYHVATNIQVQR